MNVLIKKIIESLSIEELSKLCTGEDFWHTHPIKMYDIPSMMLSDGPHGLRKQSDEGDHLGVNDSITAICFPSASSIASSFDRNIAYSIGKLLGAEARAEGIQILLGPAINIKRTPLCGRNFEYFSEDPFLTGELASEFVRGIETNGVGACVKHYAANNQENNRMNVSVEIDERTLREIYLSAFERVIKYNPAAVMSSYNRINGEYVGESRRFLTDILRNEWGFKGIVISDWYAVNDRVKALKAGLDLEMPGGVIASAKKIEEAAFKDMEVKNALIDSSVRILETVKKLQNKKTAPYDVEDHHDQAVMFASECAVLLKNDNVLPLEKREKVLLIGDYVKNPKFQGGGSSHVKAYYVDKIINYLANADYFDFEPSDNSYASCLKQIAGEYDKIIVFADIPNDYESEGYDRESLALPALTNETIELVAECGNKVVVVLCNGAPVTMPWLDKVDAVLLMGLCGEGSAKACAKLLMGEANPSGRLSESYPLKLEHNPSYINSRGENNVNYAEGVFVGYRYYTSKKIPTLFPFGYGLSYTQFHYKNLKVEKYEKQILVSITVRNAGSIDGKEVVQLYVAPPLNGVINRPSIELRGFQKVLIKSGTECIVTFELNDKDLRYFDPRTNEFKVESGKYRFIISRSAEEEICSDFLDIVGDIIPPVIDDNVTIGQLLNYPKTSELIYSIIKGYSVEAEGDAIGQQMKKSMIKNAPLRLVKGIAKLDNKTYENLLEKLKVLAEN